MSKGQPNADFLNINLGRVQVTLHSAGTRGRTHTEKVKDRKRLIFTTVEFTHGLTHAKGKVRRSASQTDGGCSSEFKMFYANRSGANFKSLNIISNFSLLQQ